MALQGTNQQKSTFEALFEALFDGFLSCKTDCLNSSLSILPPFFPGVVRPSYWAVPAHRERPPLPALRHLVAPAAPAAAALARAAV